MCLAYILKGIHEGPLSSSLVYRRSCVAGDDQSRERTFIGTLVILRDFPRFVRLFLDIKNVRLGANFKEGSISRMASLS